LVLHLLSLPCHSFHNHVSRIILISFHLSFLLSSFLLNSLPPFSLQFCLPGSSLLSFHPEPHSFPFIQNLTPFCSSRISLHILSSFFSSPLIYYTQQRDFSVITILDLLFFLHHTFSALFSNFLPRYHLPPFHPYCFLFFIFLSIFLLSASCSFLPHLILLSFIFISSSLSLLPCFEAPLY